MMDGHEKRFLFVDTVVYYSNLYQDFIYEALASRETYYSLARVYLYEYVD